MKDCHAVISVMRVSQYILNDVEMTAVISKNGFMGILEATSEEGEKGIHFLEAG